MRLQTKLMIGISMTVLLMGAIFGCIYSNLSEESLKKEKGLKALSIAETLAADDDIIYAFTIKDPSSIIQPIAEEIRVKVGAEFIVVGNTDEIRFSHPNPEKIGRKMVGGDNREVLAGNSIVSESVGSLGPSIRGKAAIFDDEGKVVGVVSVGFLQTDIAEEVGVVQKKIFLYTLTVLAVGILAAFLITVSIKKALFGLEPKEIAYMYQEKHTILESIHEGIIAIDRDGIITVVNEKAHEFLDVPLDVLLRGTPIKEVLEDTHLMDVVLNEKAEYDQEFMIRGQLYMANRIPVFDRKGQINGAVASLRNKSELARALQELSHMKSYAEGLRAQTHEYSNKLYTILGLIQIGSYERAINFIANETSVTQEQISKIVNEIPDQVIAGCILGKCNLASEWKITFEFDEESTFEDIPTWIQKGLLVTVIGNLINNAFDAVLESGKPDKKVKLFLTDIGKDLIIEVSDNGTGIAEEHQQSIFEKGYTTKDRNKNAGLGLGLVRNALETMEGYILFDTFPGKGTIFTVVIPKERGQHDGEN